MLDAILGQTEAMLQQKRAAIVRFVNLDYVVNGRRADDSSNGDLEKISAEIVTQKKLGLKPNKLVAIRIGC